MALLWTAKNSAAAYEVRSAGRSVRLYTNGVFHSQWNPTRPLGNAIWDLMVLGGFPVSVARQGAPLRVLLLGVGGGAVVRQMLDLFNIDTIVGIEIDRTHIAIANRWFGIGDFSQVSLIQADAVAWVERYRGPGFDIVIDDLFGHATNDICRAVAFDTKWATALERLCKPSGALIVNTASGDEFSQASLKMRTAFQKRKRDALGVCLKHAEFDNQFLVGLTQPMEHRWRQAWQQSVETSMHYIELSTAKKNTVRRCAAAHLARAHRIFLYQSMSVRKNS